MKLVEEFSNAKLVTSCISSVHFILIKLLTVEVKV